MENDLISRQAAIEIIKNYCENGCDYAEDNWCPNCQREKFVELLKALPSAQPEIIRCKDCKYWMKNPYRESSVFGLCFKHKDIAIATDETDWCSWAERKE